MHGVDGSQRFPALYKAIGKMTASGHWAAAVSPRGFDVEAEDDRISAPVMVAAVAIAAEPEVRAKPAVLSGEPTVWVAPDEARPSAGQRLERLARVRAERELAYERARMVQTVDRMRVAEAERAAAIEDQLRWGGRLGRRGLPAVS